MNNIEEVASGSYACHHKRQRAAIHTQQEWEDIKPHLIKRYRDEKRTLKETMRLLESTFGFFATSVNDTDAFPLV